MSRYEIKPPRPGRVRESVPVYEPQTPGAPAVFQLIMGERGRLVLPVEIRERLNISTGDPLALMLEADGTVSLKTRKVAIQNLRGMFRHLATPGRLASDDLIAEGRREAAMEERESRAFARKYRRWQQKKRA